VLSSVRYLLVVALVGALAILTVAEHVERTKLGYEIRELEEERDRLAEEEKTARLAYEQAAVPERLVDRAVALGVVEPGDVEGLTGATR